MNDSVFAPIKDKSFPYRYHGTIEVDTLVGGVPSNENVAKAWLETKLKGSKTDEQIQRMVAETMVERKISADEALEIVNNLKNLNGFKKGEEKDSLGLPTGHDGELFYEGRQLKAALKEAVSVAASVGKLKIQGWGNTRKWIQGFFPEHVFVAEKRLYLGVMEPTGVLQQFVHTRFGSSIQYQEHVDNATFDFTIVTDHLFTDRDWAMIWTTGEMNGLGASRSQGYGTYRVIRWEKDFDKSALKELEAATAEQEALGDVDQSDPVENDLPLVRSRKKAKAA